MGSVLLYAMMLKLRAAFHSIIALCVMLLGPISAAADTQYNLLSGGIDAAARATSVPSGILTRLLWVESRFSPLAVSPAGAEGVAQFMPATATERGLRDPFAPEQAIPQAARLLADLTFRFGNIGLGLAAYNAGSGRIARWLEGTGYLPDETERFVTVITGQSAEQWAAAARFDPRRLGAIGCRQSCANPGRLQIAGLGVAHAKMLPILAQSGRPLPILQGSGRPLALLENSGQPLPFLQQSGRPLPALRRSGEPLREPRIENRRRASN